MATKIRLSLLLFFSLLNTMLMAHGISHSDQSSLLTGGYIDYIRLGATHMLTGYDHLLFLLGVIFFLTSFKDILKFITVFTLGHSITLIFATLMQITANYHLVDAIIALSVCYKGFENIGGFQKFLKIKSPHLLSMIFLFGLIHGFGLSTRLQQLPLGDTHLIPRILSFNIGVEIGQILALYIMIVLIQQWRKTTTFTQLSKAINVGLIIAGVGLFAFQIQNLVTTQKPQHKIGRAHV